MQGANGYNKLVWDIQNIEYGNTSQYLNCECNQYQNIKYKNQKLKSNGYKHCTNCNCNKGCNKLNKEYLTNCKKYLKVYNRFGDITYNTVDGWPPLGANNTSDFVYNPTTSIPKYGQAPTQNYNDYLQYTRFKNLQWIKGNNNYNVRKKQLNEFMIILYKYKNNYKLKNKMINIYINNLYNKK